jgi:hypothetical protein
MKKLLVVTLAALLAANAFAICDTWTQSRSGYSGSGNVTNVSGVSCYSTDAWSFGSGNSYRQKTFSVTSVESSSGWWIGSYIDFSSSGGTPQDNFEIDIDVTHPDYSVSRYTLLYWSGAYGSLSSCDGIHYRYFTANVGDTITVTVRATNSGSANIVVTTPFIYNCS